MELNKVNRFGYIPQGLDLTLRARTIHNEIICSNVPFEGTSGSHKGEPVKLLEILEKANWIVYLVKLKKNAAVSK